MAQKNGARRDVWGFESSVSAQPTTVVSDDALVVIEREVEKLDAESSARNSQK